MRERGIVFNAEMVRAVLDGRKTQTRRIMKNQPVPSKTREGDFWFSCNMTRSMVHVSDFIPGNCANLPDAHEYFSMCCPFGAVGDRLWVRETWAEAGGSAPELQLYRANYPAHVPSKYENVPPPESIRWRPSIHMPRWASRITLEITGVRVERLDGISNADAMSEGVGVAYGWDETKDVMPRDARRRFAELWQSIYGDESWQANPWVWVIEFKRVEGVHVQTS